MFAYQLSLLAFLLGPAFALPATANIAPIAPITSAVPAVPAASGIPAANGKPPAANGKLNLTPARNPNLNSTDMTKLQAAKSCKMYYDSDPNPNKDSMMASLAANSTKYPIVMLEDTRYIKSVECTGNVANVAFNDKTAYETAANDWQKHPQMVLMSHSPKCGRGVAAGTRDLMMVNNITRQDGSQTIQAAMRFVDYETAMGNTTNAHLSIYQYQAPRPRRLAKRLGNPFGGLVSKVAGVASDVKGGVTKAASAVETKATAAVSAVKSDANSAVSDVKSKASDVKSEAVTVASDVKSKATDVASDIKSGGHIDKSTTMAWSSFPTTSLSTNDFGSGFQLHHSNDLDAICVGCGTNGSLTLTAEMDFSPSNVGSATISLKGSMAGTLALGLVGRNASVPIPLPSVGLGSIGLTPLNVPDIVTIGPQLDFSAAGNVKVTLTGNMLVGASLQWDNVDIEASVTDKSSHKANGLVPKVVPQFQTKVDDVSATLNLSLPISFGIGVSLLAGKFKKEVDLVDAPSFALTAAKGKDDTSCSGVGLNANFGNNFGIDILGLTSVGLESTTLPLTSTCIAAKSAASSAATTTEGNSASQTNAASSAAATTDGDSASQTNAASSAATTTEGDSASQTTDGGSTTSISSAADATAAIKRAPVLLTMPALAVTALPAPVHVH